MRNPLRILPSALAMHDLQPRLHKTLATTNICEEELTATLRLDPLAVLRGLRELHAPIFRSPATGICVGSIVQGLGIAASRRLLACPPVEVAPNAPVRGQWLHSVATAIAAEDLAAHTQLLDPATAYVIGLVGDWSGWLQALQATFGLRPGAGAESVAHWHLPPPLPTTLQNSTAAADDDVTTWLPTDSTSLLRAAKRLAGLAGFPSPFADGTSIRPAEKADHERIERIRTRLTQALQALGLDGQPLGSMQTGVLENRLAGNRSGSLDEVVLGILGCAASATYRGIITALTSAGLRYGSYDRVFYARWSPKTGALTLRSKADASSRRLAMHRLQASAMEAHALQQAIAGDRPVLLEAPARVGPGILSALSTDELIAVPLNRTLQQPSFLLMDRSLTLTPLAIDQIGSMATTIGRTGSLLIENLLLRRQRQRAQKFALTDPLTRLFNRRMGLVALEQEIARAERSLRPVTVMMCDLDHFKQLNDTHGHLQGDHALRATADVLRSTLRKVDTVCRLGGEEFLVILPDTPPSDATILATRLFTSVQRRGEELGLPITVSIGLTTFRPGDTVESILHRADHALYASKGHGRNRFSADLEPLDDAAPARK